VNSPRINFTNAHDARLSNSEFTPPTEKESLTDWLRTLSAHNIPYDNVLEELVEAAEARINQLRSSGEGIQIQNSILNEEAQLMTRLTICAGGTNHEGRVVQVLELQTRHIGTALEYLRLHLCERPNALLSDLSIVTEALAFDQRALINELSLMSDPERFVSRSTLRETLLGYAETIVDSLNHYPTKINGLYQFPQIPELLIDAALESIRIFFELDAEFPNKYQQKRLNDVSFGIAQAMHLQLKTFFSLTCLAHENSDAEPRAIDLPYNQTYLASERLLRFTRRILGGINSTASFHNTTHGDLLVLQLSNANDIRNNLKDISHKCRPVMAIFPKDLEILYIDLLTPNSSQYAAYCSNEKFVLLPRTFSFGF
jgi:hypothetical protein